MLYTVQMIGSFGGKAPRKFWTKNERGAVSADWSRKIHLLLSALDSAAKPDDMAFPGSVFHALTGDRAGQYALTLSRNWRITFSWDNGDAVDVDLEDYHGK